MDLGKIQSTSSSIVWALGVVRDPIVEYTLVPDTPQARRPYFYSDPKFSSQKIEDVIDFFLQDYESAVERAEILDARILLDTATVAVGKVVEYFNLVSLSARQTLAGFDITVGQENMNDIKSFTKNTGVASITNNVPTFYASLPAFLYLNATWVGYLLDSSLELQNVALPVNNFAASSDLGPYPKASGSVPSGVEGKLVSDFSQKLLKSSHYEYQIQGQCL
ncbi:hypothetical protein VKT23_008546 [Stygiomarasmius scandens]|uniref:Uncharacterized protein n=1 Tax=Marasmiellus scandens TaxID=2682957 RepID=A0ABR1JJA9_9AGAR